MLHINLKSRIRKLEKEARFKSRPGVVIYHVDPDDPKYIVGNDGTRFTGDEFKARKENEYPDGGRVLIIDDIYDPLGVFL